jgi:hypothetical protein
VKVWYKFLPFSYPRDIPGNTICLVIPKLVLDVSSQKFPEDIPERIPGRE